MMPTRVKSQGGIKQVAKALGLLEKVMQFCKA